MANNNWIQFGGTGTGNWSDTNHWSLGHVPDATEPAIFDANSFNGASQVVTVDATSLCLEMDWTGATNTPSLAVGANIISVAGSVTFIAAMAVTGSTGYLVSTGTGTITCAGITLGCRYQINGSGITITLADAINIGTNTFYFREGTLATGDNTITSGYFFDSNQTTAKTLTLGASTVNCSTFSFPATGLTVSANTATINVTGTGAVALGAADYNGADFNLNGTAHTVTGDGTGIVHFTRTGTAAANTVTFNSNLTCAGTLTLNGNAAGNRLTVGGTANILTCLALAGNHVDFSTPLTFVITNAGAGATTFAGNGQTWPHIRQEGAGAYALTISGDNTVEKFRNNSSVAVKTTTLTPTSTQTIRNLQVFSSAVNVAVFNTGGAAATIQGHRGYCELNHVNLTSIIAGEKYKYYAGNNSTDGTGNTNWIFTHKARYVD